MHKYVDAHTLRCDAVVVGAGLVGLTTALVLRRCGYKVCVVDKHAAPQTNTKKTSPSAWVSALNHASIHLLNALDVWPELASSHATQPYTRMQVGFSEHSGQLAFDSSEIGEKQLGCIVDNDALKSILWRRLQSVLEPDAYIQATPQAWDADQGGLLLENGVRVQPSLLLAADGALSWLRTQAGVGYACDDLAQGAWVAMIQHARMHGDVARQSFTPLGVIGLLPLSDPYKSVVIWSTRSDARASALDFLQSNGLEAYFSEIGTYRCESNPLFFPIHSGQSETFYKKNMILLGDAAVSVHPLAGLGLNLGLRGVQALQTLLHEDGSAPALTEQRVSALTKSYHAKTYPHALVTRRFILGCLRASQSVVVGRTLGALGFATVQALPWLKRGFARYAMQG